MRGHFARTRAPLPVVLVLEEAGALGLVTPFVLSALQELRKAGLAVHLITQSSLDFGDPSVFEAMLANVPWQAWHQVLAPADQELGARALANATFDPLSVHFSRLRQVGGESHSDPYYRPPSLHEQEYRTRLASLRVGERLVRDRRGVRRETVRRLPGRWPWALSERRTRAVIADIRSGTCYLAPPVPSLSRADGDLPGAAARLAG